MEGSNEAGVRRVMSLGISSRVRPTASLAAILAMGKPVALLARAELLDTLGFISITTIRPSSGLSPNWMFEPPHSTPTLRMQAMAASRMAWYSRSESVCAGATVMESPVWTPMGSKFSMEQMMDTLSRRSRMTSSSNSFQPRTLSSSSTWSTGLSESAQASFSPNSSSANATAPPDPPSVKAGRRMSGKPSRRAARAPSSIVETTSLAGRSRPISPIARRNRSLSSARRMAGSFAPMSSTPQASSAPDSASATAVFSPVCPPMVGRRASGRSFSMIASATRGVMGST